MKELRWDICAKPLGEEPGIGWEPFSVGIQAGAELVYWRKPYGNESTRLLTVREVCAVLEVSDSTIRRWLRLGTMPAPTRMRPRFGWPEDVVLQMRNGGLA